MGLIAAVFILGMVAGYIVLRLVGVLLELVEILREEQLWR